ncbi:MAG: hypothetical protein K0R18_148 [Bacillales bacterium]|jgi:hypothetical protein|nr:hypothetical protein [Bacillales bacterium]
MPDMKIPFVDDALNSWVQEHIVGHLADLFHLLSDSLQTGANSFLSEMLGFVLQTPLIAANPVILQIWAIVRVISFSIIGLMFVWEAFKKIISSDNVIRHVEFKEMFIRMVYGIILAVFSLDIIDMMIGLDNALVNTVKNAFPIIVNNSITVNGTFSFIMTLVLIVVQIVLGVKLMIQYWMRMAEIWLMAVLGPLMYTLWINPKWGGYLSSWVSRLTTNIFTTFVWALIISLYSGMVSIVASTGMLIGFPTLGPIAGICLSIALLLVMIETPDFLRQHLASGKNPIAMIKSTVNNVRNSTPLRITKRAAGWMLKK